MEPRGKKQKKAIRVKKGRLLIIVLVVVFVLGFGKMRSFFGKYTGENATDGNGFASDTVAYDYDAKEVVLQDGSVVYLPDLKELDFSSEHQIQSIPIGNPSQNEENIYIAATLTVQEHELLDTAMFRPGEGIDEVDLKAYFQPDQEYVADVSYTIYRQGEPQIDIVEVVQDQVTISVTGSSEYYDNKVGNTSDEKGN